MNFFTEPVWSPYIVGAGIGILSWFTFFLSNKPVACSTAFGRLGAFIEIIIRGTKAKQREYYQKYSFSFDWELTFIIGIFLGALLSASFSGSFNLHFVPSLWSASFGDGVGLRLFYALLGGIIIGFGSRCTGGCTSGHGISGTMQLAVSSWLAVIFFFIGGIVTTYIIYNIF